MGGGGGDGAKSDDRKKWWAFPIYFLYGFIAFFQYLQLWVLDKLRGATNYINQSDNGEDKSIITKNLFISFIFEL
jgi:hypothetical protein